MFLLLFTCLTLSFSHFFFNQTLQTAQRRSHSNIHNNDIQYNDIQYNDIQHNDIQHNDIQHNNIKYNYKQYVEMILKYVDQSTF